jgi:hypothetical protein
MRKIARRGSLGPRCAPFHHWDATDYTGDGVDDIVVSADNDLCSGLNAGAIYLLDGAAITGAQSG